ncbi:MAG TPA: ribosomal protein S18-alanine N-acetyltransferase [Terriglobia bacterium]|nr:ribosomal protein S18-alanine N-acetyltransferase [Terriglobia bacterium]
MIEIRPAAPQDVPEILAIQTSVFQDAAWRAEDYRRMLDDAESLVLVAQDRDSQELVGYAAARSACGQAELLHLAVKPSRQRSGAGKALVRETCRRLQQAGVCAIYLEVRASNSPALSLYRSLGFTPISVRKDYYTHPREDACVLSLPLGAEWAGRARRAKA